MKERFCEDGRSRLEAHPDYQAERKARVEAIKAEYAPRLAQARGFQRLRLKWQMWQAIRRLGPSEASLWGAAGVSAEWRSPAAPEQ
ncbi:MAG: hypothetical protein RMK51_04580 [Meiothermus sp.]|uniref:hypothetical protein n=1 Tax=Meiothermus sp. TaxID=1955249 RepID=UPI0025CF17D1|nr:hypothetical protein [Meiothermus sp.]MCS7068279.1 hypothetical protein [Meiothermus sp.]MDW8425188.1 hypothetical protein [Meiothermus sp.]